MKARKLKKAIRKLPLDDPTHSFEARVMSRLEAREDLSLKPDLAQLLKQNISAEPSDFFTAQVMRQLKPKKQPVPLPVISAKAWFWVAAILAMVVSVAVFSSSKSAAGPGNTGSWAVTSVHAISRFGQQMSTYLVALSSLLLIDYFWRRKRAFPSPTA
jgi:hypothetical protein